MSSKYADVYNLACKLVEDLLGGLYKEYEGFCQKAGRPLSKPVQIKRSEVGTERKMSDDNKSTPSATPRSRQNSIDANLCQGFSKAVNVVNGNSPSGQGSTTNSLSSLSDREMNSSPPKQTLCMDEVSFNKSP